MDLLKARVYPRDIIFNLDVLPPHFASRDTSRCLSEALLNS